MDWMIWQIGRQRTRRWVDPRRPRLSDSIVRNRNRNARAYTARIYISKGQVRVSDNSIIILRRLIHRSNDPGITELIPSTAMYTVFTKCTCSRNHAQMLYSTGARKRSFVMFTLLRLNIYITAVTGLYKLLRDTNVSNYIVCAVLDRNIRSQNGHFSDR